MFFWILTVFRYFSNIYIMGMFSKYVYACVCMCTLYICGIYGSCVCMYVGTCKSGICVCLWVCMWMGYVCVSVCVHASSHVCVVCVCQHSTFLKWDSVLWVITQDCFLFLVSDLLLMATCKHFTKHLHGRWKLGGLMRNLLQFIEKLSQNGHGQRLGLLKVMFT